MNVAEGDIAEMSADDVVTALKAGKVSEDTLVWREGMAEWLPLVEVPSFRLVASSAKPSPSQSPVAAATASEPPPAADAAPRLSRGPIPRPNLAPRDSTNPRPASTPPARLTSPPVGKSLASMAVRAGPSSGGQRAALRTRPVPVERKSSTQTSVAPPPAPAPAEYTDDEEEATHVMTAAKMRRLRPATAVPRSTPPAESAPPAAPDPAPEGTPKPGEGAALAVYDRPVATIAFPDSVPPPPVPPVPPAAAVAEPSPAPSIEVEPPKRHSPPAPEPAVVLNVPSEPDAAARRADQTIPPGRGLQAVVASVAPVIPDSFTPVTQTDEELARAVLPMRRGPSRVVIASVVSAIAASVLTALVLSDPPAPNPLLVTPAAAARPLETQAAAALAVESAPAAVPASAVPVEMPAPQPTATTTAEAVPVAEKKVSKRLRARATGQAKPGNAEQFVLEEDSSSASSASAAKQDEPAVKPAKSSGADVSASDSATGNGKDEPGF